MPINNSKCAEELAGNYRTFSYDAEGMLTEKKAFSAEDQLSSRTTYAYDSAGRLLLTRDYVASEGDDPVRSVRYTYDGLGRKSSFKQWEGASEPADATGSYEYDAYGRTTSMAYAYGSDDPFSEYSYTYDKAGRITRESVSLSHADSPEPGHAREYTYDPNGWLTRVRETTSQNVQN